MSEKVSRILLVIEALILCLPLSILYFFAGLPAILRSISNGVYEPAYLTIVDSAAIVAGIVSAWWLMGSFIIRGNRALMGTAKIWWIIAGANAVLALAAISHVTLTESYGPSSELGFGWGVFFLPPYIHLLLERCRYSEGKSGLILRWNSIGNGWKTIASVALFMLCSVAAWQFLHSTFGSSDEEQLAFEQQEWLHGTNGNQMHFPRLAMADDLLAKRTLYGMERNRVYEMLGEPDMTDVPLHHAGEKVDLYWLGPERGLFSADSEWLTIEFDKNNRVVACSLWRD